MKRPINESVRLAIEQEGWWDRIDLDQIDESRNDQLNRLVKIIRSKHFGILSPSRSFPFHHDMIHKGMRDLKPDEDETKAQAVYSGDNTTAKLIGTKVTGTRSETKANHSREAWRQLRSAVSHLGFRPVIAVGSFQEEGGSLASESTLLLAGKSQTGVKLTKAMMASWAKRYNQDSFIYAGPETEGSIQLFNVSDRGKSGLPTAYESTVSLGRSEAPTSIKDLISRLYAGAEDPGKIYGVTQPRQHGEVPPGDPKFGRTPGKGRGVTITDPTQTKGKTYL